MSNGQLDHIARWHQQETGLFEGLPEGASPQEQRTIVILHRSSECFRGTRAALIDEDNQGQRRKVPSSLRDEVAVRVHLPPPRPKDECPLREELRRDFYCGVHHTAGVVAQVQDHLLGPGPLELFQCSMQLLVRLCPKPAEP